MSRSEESVERTPIIKLFRESSLQFFLDRIYPGASVLDCGCGEGDVSIPLAERECQVDAIDRNPDRIAVLEARKGALPIRTHLCDMLAVPFKLGSFDYVISRQFMPHFDNWPEVLDIQISLCKIGGAVIFHHHAGENFALCEALAPTVTHRVAVRRVYLRNGHATREELQRVCKWSGAELESLTPISFFLPSALLYRTGLDQAEREQYGMELEQRMMHSEVYGFVRWYEARIIARLPAALSSSFMAVVRRSGGSLSLVQSVRKRIGALIRHVRW